MKPYSEYVVRLGDLKQAIVKNPYDPTKNIDGYMRYLKYNTSEVQPERKRGKWMKAVEDEREQIVWNECSECGQALSWQPNYCPNCGADMRGEEDG